MVVNVLLFSCYLNDHWLHGFQSPCYAYLSLFVLLASKLVIFCSLLDIRHFFLKLPTRNKIKPQGPFKINWRLLESNAGPWGREASVPTSSSPFRTYSRGPLVAYLFFIQQTKQRVSASGTSANLGRKFSNMEFVLRRKFVAPCRPSSARTGLESWLSAAASRPFSTPSSRRWSSLSLTIQVCCWSSGFLWNC